MSFILIPPSRKRELVQAPAIRIQGRQIYFNRSATRDIFSDQSGYVQFFLDTEKKLLGVKPVNAPENAFTFRVYRRDVSPLGVVFAAEIVANILKIMGIPNERFLLVADPNSGMHIIDLK